MPQISTLVTGAGVVTPITGQAALDSYLVLGDIDTAMPLQSIVVDVNGETTVNIQGSQPLCSVFAKFMQRISASTVGVQIKLATGKISGPTNIRLTNNGATTPIITTFSDGGKGAPIKAMTDTVNASSYKTYGKFSWLFMLSANLSTCDVTFMDGHVQQMSAIDMDSLFASKNDTEANGRLDAAVTGFDNRDGSIREVKINAGAGGGVTIMLVNLSDIDFKALKQGY